MASGERVIVVVAASCSRGDMMRGVHTDLKNRQWRRSKRNNGKNFIEKMRDAARNNARVFQLRIAGRRSWWPASSGPTISSAIPRTSSTMTVGARQNNSRGVSKCCNDDRETCKQKKNHGKHKRGPVVLTNSIDKLLLEGDNVNRNQIMSMKEKRHKQEGTINSTNKNKFEWKFWKKIGRANDIDETTSIDGDTVQSSITNTSNNNTTNNSENNNKDNILLDDDDSAIMEIAEKIEDTEEKKMKQKILTAVATTSVSSLGVALAIILL